jgi:hypothetical protein
MSVENNNQDLPDLGNPPAPNEEGQGAVQYSDEGVFQYLKDKGYEGSTIEDIFVKPEPVIETKEVNPWQDVMDEGDVAYLTYKKETGRGRKEYESLQTNLDEVSPLEFARQQVINESGMKLSKEQIDEYLESELGIDDLSELNTSDLVKLSKYGKPIKDARLEEQSKYRQPLPKTEVPQNQNTNQDEYVQLANGTFMKKSDFETAQQNQINHNKMVQEAVNSVTATSFKIAIDDNGEQKELNYDYNYSDTDRSSAVSMVTDLGKYVQDTYQSEQGFNHKRFAEDVFWLDPKNRETVINSIAHKVRAEAIEEVMKQRGNVDYTNRNNNLSNQEKPKIMTVKEIFNQNR